MYDVIRQQIRQNRLRKAMHDMGGLDLSREHASRLVTLDRRLHIIENKKISNDTEDRLITIEENGLVQDMLVFLDQVEFPQRDIEPKKFDYSGEAAGAEQGSKSSMTKWLGLAAALIALLTIGFLLWPDTNNNAGKVPPTGEVSVPPTGDAPSGRLTDEERKKEAQRQEDEKIKEDLRQQELLKERERQKRIAEAKKRQLAEETGQTTPESEVSFMNRSKQVDMAVAVYSGPASSTKIDVYLTKNLSSYLGRAIQGKTNSPVILTSGFHDSKERELIIFGRSRGDKRLNPKLATYLVLADVRNVNKEGKAELRMCIYDSATGKTLIRKETTDVGTASQMKEKYILLAVKAFITEELKF